MITSDSMQDGVADYVKQCALSCRSDAMGGILNNILYEEKTMNLVPATVPTMLDLMILFVIQMIQFVVKFVAGK